MSTGPLGFISGRGQIVLSADRPHQEFRQELRCSLETDDGLSRVGRIESYALLSGSDDLKKLPPCSSLTALVADHPRTMGFES